MCLKRADFRISLVKFYYAEIDHKTFSWEPSHNCKNCLDLVAAFENERGAGGNAPGGTATNGGGVGASSDGEGVASVSGLH